MPIDTDQLLRDEYFQLQKTVEDFDGRTLTIKAWSVTFSAAGLGLAYQQGKPQLLLIAAASAWVFWLIESAWKVHQRAFYRRIDQIEDWFAGRWPKGEPAPPPLQILNQWRESYRNEGLFELWVRPSFGLGVIMPHVLITLAGLYLYFREPPQAAAPPKAEPRLEIRLR